MWRSLMVLCLLPAVVLAQEDIRFLDCSVWQGTCPEAVMEETTPLSVQPSPVPSLELFPPQTLAPDTPPLFVTLLHEPTLDNARLFYAWNQARNQVAHQVQQLIYQAAQEAKGKGR